ncbi:hypothetical protein BDZ97DRAFT_320336 [Flammula alnicola]|nr:hypothetical protein BDZ97DRAFT_320336 [Flammula alnicola]
MPASSVAAQLFPNHSQVQHDSFAYSSPIQPPIQRPEHNLSSSSSGYLNSPLPLGALGGNGAPPTQYYTSAPSGYHSGQLSMHDSRIMPQSYMSPPYVSCLGQHGLGARAICFSHKDAMNVQVPVSLRPPVTRICCSAAVRRLNHHITIDGQASRLNECIDFTRLWFYLCRHRSVLRKEIDVGDASREAGTVSPRDLMLFANSCRSLGLRLSM